MRLYGISSVAVESVIADPTQASLDGKGNRRLAGSEASGRAIIVVVAGDYPDFVITTFPDD